MMLYGSLLLLYALFFLGTIPYKRRIRKKLDHKKHKLWMFYGMAMFLVDWVPQKKRQGNVTINKAMQQLYVKEDIHKERDLYFAEKVATSLGILLFALGIGLGVTISEDRESSHPIHNLEREEMLEQEYDLIAKKGNDKSEEIHLKVGGRIRTEKELQTILKNNRERLLKEFLGENNDLMHITENLHPVSVLGEDKILVTWEINNQKLVDMEGNIIGEVAEQGEDVSFVATMSLEEISLRVPIHGKIYPKNGKERLEQQIQSQVNKAGETQKSVKLPEKIDGQKMSYYSQIDPIGTMIVPAGIFLAILIFFLKDRELKEKITERRIQMEDDYSELIGKFVLFYQAGLSFASTLEKILAEYREEKQRNPGYSRFTYEELEIAGAKMKSGVSDIQAIIEFGERCGLQNYMRLATIIEQNQRRGTKELILALQSEQREALAERKNRAMKKGSEISTKLLGPMVIMLVVTMIIVVVPSFLSMRVK